MSKNMFRCLTDLLPVAGGASGAAVAAETALPSVGSILVFVGMTVLGAVVGYMVKLVLDKIFNKKTNGK